jgi:hypothetical protein
MKNEEQLEIMGRAKTKKDGIYSYRGYFYLVLNKQLSAYTDYFGNVIERSFGFNVDKGKVGNRFEGKKILAGYLKQKGASR